MIRSLNGLGNNAYQMTRPPKQDPDTYAQSYAVQNGISLEQAKNELRAKYGEPEEKVTSQNNAHTQYNDLNNYFNNYNYIQINKPPKQDPDTYAQNYATQNGISLEQAKNELRAKYGEPEEKNAGNNTKNGFFNQNLSFISTNNSKEQETVNPFVASNASSSDNTSDNLNNNPFGFTPEEQEMFEAGVPSDLIKEGGNDLRNYLIENNLTEFLK